MTENMEFQGEPEDRQRILLADDEASIRRILETRLKMAGYDVYEVKSQSVFDPAFGATKTPNPEEAGAYEEVLKLAKEIDAKLLLVCDPDERTALCADYLLLHLYEPGYR